MTYFRLLHTFVNAGILINGREQDSGQWNIKIATEWNGEKKNVTSGEKNKHVLATDTSTHTKRSLPILMQTDEVYANPNRNNRLLHLRNSDPIVLLLI